MAEILKAMGADGAAPADAPDAAEDAVAAEPKIQEVE
jgi:hypothetical protein